MITHWLTQHITHMGLKCGPSFVFSAVSYALR